MLQGLAAAGFYVCYYGSRKKAVWVGLGAGLLSLLAYGAFLWRPAVAWLRMLPLGQALWLWLCGRLWQTKNKDELLLGSGLYLMVATLAQLLAGTDLLTNAQTALNARTALNPQSASAALSQIPLQTALLTAAGALALLGLVGRIRWRPLWIVLLLLSAGFGRALGSIVYAASWQQKTMQAALYLILGGILVAQQVNCAHGALRLRRRPASKSSALRPEAGWQQTAGDEIQRLLIFEHDFRHHLDMVAVLYEEGRADEARAYMEDVKQARLSGRGRRMCSATALSYILMAKKQQCREAGIRLSYQIVGCPEGIAQMDVASLLFNLVDNAIRACQSAPGTDRGITLMLLSRGLLWQVEMRNTGVYDPAAEPQKGHGIGLVSVRQITKKYGGTYEIRQEGDEVVQKMILMDSVTEKG